MTSRKVVLAPKAGRAQVCAPESRDCPPGGAGGGAVYGEPLDLAGEHAEDTGQSLGTC